MNRLAGIAVIIVLALVGAATYLYMNPHHMPRVFSNPTTGIQVPQPSSPMSNFRPPQF